MDVTVHNDRKQETDSWTIAEVLLFWHFLKAMTPSLPTTETEDELSLKIDVLFSYRWVCVYGYQDISALWGHFDLGLGLEAGI